MKIKVTEIDKVFARYIRLRDGKCQFCGADKKRLECSHFHGRRKRSTRYDEENVCALCHGCHMYLGENPHTHTDFFRQRLGTERLEKLRIRAETIRKFTPDEIEQLIQVYKEKIKFLEGG